MRNSERLHRFVKLLIAGVIVLALVAACGGDDGQESQAIFPTRTPTPTRVLPVVDNVGHGFSIPEETPPANQLDGVDLNAQWAAQQVRVTCDNTNLRTGEIATTSHIVTMGEIDEVGDIYTGICDFTPELLENQQDDFDQSAYVTDAAEPVARVGGAPTPTGD